MDIIRLNKTWSVSSICVNHRPYFKLFSKILWRNCIGFCRSGKMLTYFWVLGRVTVALYLKHIRHSKCRFSFIIFIPECYWKPHHSFPCSPSPSLSFPRRARFILVSSVMRKDPVYETSRSNHRPGQIVRDTTQTYYILLCKYIMLPYAPQCNNYNSQLMSYLWINKKLLPYV